MAASQKRSRKRNPKLVPKARPRRCQCPPSLTGLRRPAGFAGFAIVAGSRRSHQEVTARATRPAKTPQSDQPRAAAANESKKSRARLRVSKIISKMMEDEPAEPVEPAASAALRAGEPSPEMGWLDDLATDSHDDAALIPKAAESSPRETTRKRSRVAEPAEKSDTKRLWRSPKIPWSVANYAIADQAQNRRGGHGLGL